jgi:hypothetical protein
MVQLPKLFKFEARGRLYVIKKVMKTTDTQSSVFTYYGQCLVKTAVPEYSRSKWDRDNASA